MNLADTTERLIAKWDSWLSDTGNKADTALFQKLVQTRILNEEIADDWCRTVLVNARSVDDDRD